MKIKYSIVILSSDERHDLLAKCLQSIGSSPDSEIIIIRSDGTISQKRNEGINKASGDYIIFIDDDCKASAGWFDVIKLGLTNNLVLAGDTKTIPCNYVSEAIAALGFPGGGSLGFDKVWQVDHEGYTNHVSFCNFACHKSVFESLGKLEEDMPYGAEDALFSYRLTQSGVKIKYLPEMIVYHAPRTKITEFFKWQIKRGRSNYYFKQKVGRVGDFVKLRFWSAGNSLRKYDGIRKMIVFTALTASFGLQQLGYYFERLSHGKAEN